MSASLTAADYLDWAEFAGIYLGNHSHSDRYRSYQQKLSNAGLVMRIVHDFLKDNEGGIDVQRWRNDDVYETEDYETFRIEQTALALEAVGAPRVAEKVRTTTNTSFSGMLMQHAGDPQTIRQLMTGANIAEMMQQLRANVARMAPDMAAQVGLPIPERKPVPVDTEVEMWEQIEHLLVRYMQAHESDLRADMQKYGDVRQKPGFNPQERRKELERLYREELEREHQAESVAKFDAVMNQIRNRLAKKPDLGPDRFDSERRKFLELSREFSRQRADKLIPAMQDCLKRAEQFQKDFDAIVNPKPIADKTLLKRLDSFGSYDLDVRHKQVAVKWNSPSGMECDWARFSLSIAYPEKKKKVLGQLLDTCDRLRKRFATHQAEMRQSVLESFEMYREQLADWELEDYELDDDGKPTEASVLKHADGASISVELSEDDDDPGAVIRVFFGIEWDDEHGLELFLDDEPDAAPAEQFAMPTHVQFHDGGQALTEQDLIAFEQMSGIKLPADYRQFLQLHNGRRPEPNHFKARISGGTSPLDIERLFSISAASRSSNDGDDVASALGRHREQGLSPKYLPIGLASTPGFQGGPTSAPLYLGLSGKIAGKVCACFQPYAPLEGFAQMAGNPQMAVMMTQMFESTCPAIAPSFSEFLSRLGTKPSKAEPDWLQAIRGGDVDRFEAWVKSGGKLSEQFNQYGAMRAMTAADYLTQDGPIEFLRGLLARSICKPKDLRDRWLSGDRSLSRFKQLMPLWARDQWRYAFASGEVWDDSELLTQLTEAGVDLEGAIDDEGSTPLLLAALGGRADGMRWLLIRGVSPSKPDKYGRTALCWAESNRHLECIKVLLDAGESLESLFPHMPTMNDKLRLIKSRWFDQFDALVADLRRRGLDVGNV